MDPTTRVTAFWMSVQRGGPDDCWPWTGYVNEDGYGAFYWQGRMVGAHELALTFTTGERRLPTLDTCHSRVCVTRLCCNPHHLRFDTRASNVADTVAAGNHGPRSRLADSQVRLIRERYAAGAAQIDLAAHFGISQSYVCHLIGGTKRAAAGGPIPDARKYNRRSAA